MPTRHPPALDLARRFLRNGWCRESGTGTVAGLGRRTRLAPTRSRFPPGSAGLISPRPCGHHLERVAALGGCRPRRTHRGGLPPRHGREQPVLRKCSGRFSAWPRGSPQLYVLDTTDEQTHPYRRGADDARANLVPRCQQERRNRRSVIAGALFWSRMTASSGGPRRPPLHRDHGCRNRAQARWAPPRGIARSSSTRPTSAAVSRHCRCSALFQRPSSADRPAVCSPRAKRWPTGAARRT